MLKFGNKEFRNLQEQVLENMKDIETLKEGTAVLDEFGIKVVGEVDSLADLPTVAEYKEAHEDWAYGDAFAVGTEAPYALYILTRENDSVEEDHWFDIGEFPAPGPQGPQGIQGPAGPQGQQGNTGAAAGFGVIDAQAQTLSPGSLATVLVNTSGPDTAKSIYFTFGIPRGADGEGGLTPIEIVATRRNVAAKIYDFTLSSSDLEKINENKYNCPLVISIREGQQYQPELLDTFFLTTEDTLNSQLKYRNVEYVEEGDFYPIGATEPIYKMVIGYSSVILNSSTGVGYLTVGESSVSKAGLTGSYNDLTDKPDIDAIAATAANAVNIANDAASEASNASYVASNAYTTANNAVTVAGNALSTANHADSTAGLAYSTATDAQSSANDAFVTANNAANAAQSAHNAANSAASSASSALSAAQSAYNAANDASNAASSVSGLAQDAMNAANSASADASSAVSVAASAMNAANDASSLAQSAYDAANAIVVPTKTSDLQNDSGYITGVSWSEVTDKPTFATVATTGDYDDLIDKPDVYEKVSKITIESTAFDDTSADRIFLTTNGPIEGYQSEKNNIVVKGGSGQFSRYVGIYDGGLFYKGFGSPVHTYSLPLESGTLTVNIKKSQIAPDFDAAASNEVNDLVWYVQSGTLKLFRCILAKPADVDFSLTYFEEASVDDAIKEVAAEAANASTVAQSAYNAANSAASDAANASSAASNAANLAQSAYDAANAIVVPTKTSDLQNDSGFITGVSWSEVTDKPTFATVATSGDYDDLIDKPDLSVYELATDAANIAAAAQAAHNAANDASSLAQSAYNAANSAASDAANASSAAADASSAAQAAMDAVNALDVPVIDGKTIVENQQGQIETAIGGWKESVPTEITSLSMPWGTYGQYSEYLAGVEQGTATTEQIAADATAWMAYLDDKTGGQTVDVTLMLSVDGTTWDEYAATASVYKTTYPRLRYFSCPAIELSTGEFRIQDSLGQEFFNPGYQLEGPNQELYAYAKLKVIGPGSIVYHTIDNNYIDSSIRSGAALGATAVQPGSLATVATSGSYNDLSDKPTIPTVDYPVTDVTVGGTSVLSNKVAVIPAIPDAVSGTNDGTNWTSLTIGSDTYGLASGSSEETFISAKKYFEGSAETLQTTPNASAYIGSMDVCMDASVLKNYLLAYVQNSTSNTTLQVQELNYTGATATCTLPDNTTVTGKQFNFASYYYIYAYMEESPTNWAGAVKQGKTHLWLVKSGTMPDIKVIICEHPVPEAIINLPNIVISTINNGKASGLMYSGTPAGAKSGTSITIPANAVLKLDASNLVNGAYLTGVCAWNNGLTAINGTFRDSQVTISYVDGSNNMYIWKFNTVLDGSDNYKLYLWGYNPYGAVTINIDDLTGTNFAMYFSYNRW